MEKRDEILFNVCRLFHKYGIKSVTMDDIANNIGISKKTLYTYFKDKSDLVKKSIDFIKKQSPHNVEKDLAKFFD